jgi:hypothetical protein
VSERERLQQRAQELAAGRHAKKRASELRLAEYEYRRIQATSSLRTRLEELKREYAGTVRLALSGSPTWIRIEISSRTTALQKPFAAVTVRPEGEGFYITDEIKKPERYDIPFAVLRTEDQIVDLVRDLAAEFLIKRRTTSYEFPEWYTALITIVAALGCFAGWVFITLVGGFWGALVGAVAMLGLFRILQHVGPVIVLLVAGFALFGAVAEWLSSR